MLIYTLELDKVTDGVTVESFKVPSRTNPLIGVSVGNFSQRPDEIAAPTTKVFTIRGADVGTTLTHVKAVLKSDPTTGKTGRLIGAQNVEAESDTDREQALIYVKTDDAEAKVKLDNDRNLFAEGRLCEGVIRGVIYHTNRFGRTYTNVSKPAVLLVDKDVEYTLFYRKDNAAYTKVFKFDGEKLVIVSDEKRAPRRPKKEIKILDTKFADMEANKPDTRRRGRRKNSDDDSRKESRWQ